MSAPPPPSKGIAPQTSRTMLRATATVLAVAAGASASSLVLEGYDMVAYWSLAAGESGVLGTAAHAFNLTSMDKTTNTSLGPCKFWFASEANRARFAAAPWSFAPRWGGF